MFSTEFTKKLEISKEMRFLHSLNIQFMYLTLDVIKLDKFKFVN